MVTTNRQPTTDTADVTIGTRQRRWWTVLAAVAAATASWAVAVPVLNIDLAVQTGTSPEQPIGFLAVTVTSLLAGLGGWLSLALLEKWTTKARTIWQVIAAIVLAVSLIGPLAAVSPAATAVLLGLHLIVGGIVIWGLPRGSGRRGRPRAPQTSPEPEPPE